jgi:hypothetical protein
MIARAQFVKLTWRRNKTLTILGEARRDKGFDMADSLNQVRRQLRQRMTEIHRRAARLSPLAIHEQMDAIREVAASNGMTALEGLAHSAAQLALLPGHRVTMRCCLEHLDDAVESRSPGDCTTILAALASRLH